MKLKDCTCCARKLTTREVIPHGQLEGLLYYSCKHCRSTMVLVSQALRDARKIKEETKKAS